MKEFFSQIGDKVTNSKFIRINFDIIKETFYILFNFVGNNLRNVSIILKIVLPYLMYYMGTYLYKQRGYFVIGNEIFIPLFVFIFTYYINQYANKINKGERIPIPEKRFTELGEDDEYNIEFARIEEMIFYMYNLENYLQRKGLLK